MTKRKTPPAATAASILDGLVKLVTTPGANTETYKQAISIAFEAGVSEGRLAGAKAMGDALTASTSVPR